MEIVMAYIGLGVGLATICVGVYFSYGENGVSVPVTGGIKWHGWLIAPVVLLVIFWQTMFGFSFILPLFVAIFAVNIVYCLSFLAVHRRINNAIKQAQCVEVVVDGKNSFTLKMPTGQVLGKVDFYKRLNKESPVSMSCAKISLIAGEQKLATLDMYQVNSDLRLEYPTIYIAGKTYVVLYDMVAIPIKQELAEQVYGRFLENR